MHMQEPHRHPDLDERLKSIEINITSGFAGTHKRLDGLNDQNAKNTKFREEMQWERKHDKDMRGEFRAWLLGAVAAVAMINGVVMVLVK